MKGMNKLIKEILVNKAARDNSALVALMVAAVGVGLPWMD